MKEQIQTTIDDSALTMMDKIKDLYKSSGLCDMALKGAKGWNDCAEAEQKFFHGVEQLNIQSGN
jgi:hypothetical protein